MRRPLVGVCLTASAVLLAGGIAAATTAGAQTTADPAATAEPIPSAPAGFPALPDLPALPAAPPADVPSSVPAPATPVTPAAPATSAATGADEGPQRPGGPPATRPAPAQEPHRDRPSTPAPEKPRPSRTLDTADGADRDVTPGAAGPGVDAPVQRQVLALVNEHRRRGGCAGLTLDRRLVAAANRHAADMARHGYFAHRSLDGRGTADRVSDAGYRWSRYGENIARGQDSADEVMDGWMNSPEHRENIMDCRFEQMGIGLAFDDDTPYWVQDFASPQ